ncbi:Mov34/MPN/PAD-1 family protein [Microseira wollei]|uniref:Mov34/MPN/PAD-1 family protein n=1 Tax=Microseira wollei NIES-4236 TaxID=2530354 RepID=A0AAV3XA73_9CYAN|nr:M67 family metallopeptidase [Microseira wollei]GET39338.1 Mov34/MPN/PAD-1 family protein [Microseira wollei NIES-4236]
MTIELSREHLQGICSHAESGYPQECCGLLLGLVRGDSKTVVEVRPTENAWDEEAMKAFQAMERLAKLGETKRGNYAIAPADILKVQKEARDRHLAIIAIYHSHPDCAAMPSEFDRQVAWQEYSYIIVSVCSGKAVDVTSWRLDDDRKFQSEQISVIDQLENYSKNR